VGLALGPLRPFRPHFEAVIHNTLASKCQSGYNLSKYPLQRSLKAMNWNRVVLAGLVAGVIVDASEFVLNGLVLAQDWSAAMRAINKPELSGSSIAVFNVLALISGIFVVWLYAAIRPRFGPGTKTAVYAGLATYLVGYLLPGIGNAMTQIFPTRLIVLPLIWGLVEILVASIAGAYFYKEEAAPSGAALAVGAR
jgi:hypothetical protein